MLKEDSQAWHVDPHTLETYGVWDFNGKYTAKTMSAHPKIDPVTGELHWPSALQTDMFAEQRAPVEELASKWVKYGTLDYNDQRTVRTNIDGMFDGIKSQISSIPPQDYVACRKFLQSLLYATTRTTF